MSVESVELLTYNMWQTTLYETYVMCQDVLKYLGTQK